MIIQQTTYSDIETLKKWFPDRESAYLWAGPGLDFPFTTESFLQSIRWQEIPSYSLYNAENCFAGFGQYYKKSGRCHLARLVIAPDLRGKGYGQWFFAQLIAIGMQDLAVNEASLFVLRHNDVAVGCYSALGVRVEQYPEGHEVYDGVDYMVFKRVD